MLLFFLMGVLFISMLKKKFYFIKKTFFKKFLYQTAIFNLQR